MTKDDLENAGLIYEGNTAFPNRFFIPHVGEINLYEPYNWGDIFEIIYNAGFKNGTSYGEEKKIEEIKNILNIT